MWADAKRDDHPAEYRWCRLRKFRNSIPCTMLQSLADPSVTLTKYRRTQDLNAK